MHDSLYGRRTFRTLSVIDEADRHSLGIEVATSMSAARVVRFLGQLIEIHDKPQAIRCDNGPQPTSYAFGESCNERGIELRFIQPGKPDHNAFIERFDRTDRGEVLSAFVLNTLSDVREIPDDWLERCNEIRPRDALGSPPPARSREQLLAANAPLRNRLLDVKLAT